MQGIKKQIKRWTPKPIFNLLEYQRQRLRLASAAGTPARFDALGYLAAEDLMRLFASDTTTHEWEQLEGSLRDSGIWNAPGTTGGIDLKALYFLVRQRRFRTILEVGTHVGGSTITLASALSRLGNGDDRPEIVTVDVVDVNDVDGPWRGAGLAAPPRDLVREIAAEVPIHFVKSRSTEYLDSCDRTFDFVYLDGDHNAETVYREIVRSLARLRPQGLIALHDYSPRVMFPTLLDGRAIPGPYLATRRVASEHREVVVRPVEDVPWEGGKRLSYLAVVCRA